MRIGPKMMRAVEIVGRNPGCSKKFVAEQITPCPVPSKNWAYGYEPINRAIDAGLITAKKGANGTYILDTDLVTSELLRKHP